VKFIIGSLTPDNILRVVIAALAITARLALDTLLPRHRRRR
jgi:hypothetical protein